MVVTIKVLVNGDEINQAKEKNQFYANKRSQREAELDKLETELKHSGSEFKLMPTNELNLKIKSLTDELIKVNNSDPIPDDVEVPEPIVKESTMLIDSKDVTRARRNEIGMIQIIHLGQDMQIVDNPETWAILEKRFAE